ncbi:potassium transport protein TRK1/TRK2 [Metschnikowia bicuspidata var. bicuspidata NRRL YB-4993]|uniref:Potassium transport protein n=1 Tax=Metschnikowia bicuspidata var. bicuspidata NRRL YB-4993 TaxID=869754 RepID=A0A1A0GWJ4_9ASCO|nr:potassium transport protein TRK1/TRK2 [Metschnikowia bicuspidata var. bicuspidata NRRL YB-4993]OBA16116.1 potassium transport protein TRK1/TRK2 [Metschnikowia bicuspidata var. bicuspidata NRRL YB-4993]
MALGGLRRKARRLFPADRSYGTAIRDHIHRVTLTLHPYVVKVIPNFRAAHYTYILFMAFLTSVIVYPITSFDYIDVLFLMSGALTQAGLNTINLNQLRLSQQVIVYFTATLTTPIFIHGSLLFVRLYWFERYFDNIKESSKMNFKMRRNATLAARTRSLDPPRPPAEKPRAPSPAGDTGSSTRTDMSSAKLAGPASDLDARPGAGPPPDGITFADLPRPAKRTQEVDPSDMYKSIALLQQKKRQDSGLDGEVLVIKSPNEIERDLNTPIYTTRLHFPGLRKPTKWRMPGRARGRTWDALRRTLSNSAPLTMRRRVSTGRDRDGEPGAADGSGAGPPEGLDGRNGPKDSNGFDGGVEGLDGKMASYQDMDGKMASYQDMDDKTGKDQHLDGASPSRPQQHPDSVSFDSVSDLASISSDLDGPLPQAGFSDLDIEHAVLDSDSDSDPDLDPDSGSDSGPSPPLAPHMLFKEPFGPRKKTKFAQEPTIDRHNRPSQTRSRIGLRKWRTPVVQAFDTAGLPRAPHDDDEEDEYGDAGGAPLAKVMSTNYLSWTPTVGRNSTFVHLTDEQKEELGGVEYRAIKLLIKIIFAFYIGSHVIAFCFFVGFINVAPAYAAEMRGFGLSPTWWGFFTAQSVFNDLGLTLTPNSMFSYSRSVYVLVVSSFFIVIGNTGFPILLRFVIWVMFKTARPLSLYKELLGFLLDHPRRCFTLLFPSIPTWWLLFILVVLNGTDLVLFIVLDLNNDYLKAIPLGYRILDGLFQAFSTRTAGFSVVDLSELHPSVQVSYMIMMYIAVLPLAISIRRTNVYEEQSLGIYLKADEPEHEPESTPKSFIGTHLRNQLSFDLWFIFLGLFVICIAESSKIEAGDLRFTIFLILFEIVSAYGTVGLSLGYPGVDQSLSYKFTTLSKLIIIAMMIRGRHRGLPYALDRAIMLPDADMQKRDMVQENHASNRAGTISAEPTATSFNDAASGGFTGRLRRTISRKAQEYRRNSLFPAPTKLPEELHEMRSFSRGQ